MDRRPRWIPESQGHTSSVSTLVAKPSDCTYSLAMVPMHTVAYWQNSPVSECKKKKNGGDGRVCAWGAATTKGMAWPASPVATRCQGNPRPTGIRWGGVSRSPDGLFVQQEREPIKGRPAVRGKRTYGGRPGQRVEEQGTRASRTQKQSEAGYGRPVDRGAWTAKTVKRPRQQPAQPQYANYWALLTCKRHTMPHSAQPQHTNYWAPQTRK